MRGGEVQRKKKNRPQLMSLGQVAKALSMTRHRFWRLRRRNPDFPAPVKFDGTLRWRADELLAWIRKLPRS